MWDLTVAEAHTFFVGDGAWLVHNTCRLPLRNGKTVDVSSYSDLQALWQTGQIADGIMFRGQGICTNRIIAPPGNQFNDLRITSGGLESALAYNRLVGDNLDTIITDHMRRNMFLVSSTNNLREAVGYAMRGNTETPHIAILNLQLANNMSSLPTASELSGITTLVNKYSIPNLYGAYGPSATFQSQEWGTFVEVPQSRILDWILIPR